jgi:hypothetical protein
MSPLRPLDPVFPIQRQIAIEASPVVLVNVFTLDKADEQTLLKTREDDAAFMMRQAGFISTQLHRAIGESPTDLNYAVWESTADFRAAFSHFRAKLSAAMSWGGEAAHSGKIPHKRDVTGPIRPERGERQCRMQHT